MKRMMLGSLAAASLFSVIACGSGAHEEAAHSHEQSIETPICYLADAPQVLNGEVSADSVCQCGGGAADTTPELAPPTTTVLEAPMPPAEQTEPYAASLSTRVHASDKGVCATTKFCDVSWSKKKLKELAACLGIACAALGGDGPLPKAVIDVAKAVCCVKPGEAKKHEDESNELKKQVNQACAAGPPK